jgi:hypothetical protein
LDLAILGAAGGVVQLSRNIIASVAKLGFLILSIDLGSTSGMAMYAAWSAGLMLSIPTCYRYFRKPPHRRSRRNLRRSGLEELKGVWRIAAGNHLLNLALTIPMLVHPVIAALMVTPSETARFSTARLAAMFLLTIPYALPAALLAQAGHSEEAARARIRLTLPLGLAVSLLLYAIAAPTAGFALSLFGKDYSGYGAVRDFRILCLAAVLLVIKDHYVALRRVQGRLGRAAKVILSGMALEIAAPLIGAYLGGTAGLCWGWLFALLAEAIGVAPVVVGVWKTVPSDLTVPGLGRGLIPGAHSSATSSDIPGERGQPVPHREATAQHPLAQRKRTRQPRTIRRSGEAR